MFHPRPSSGLSSLFPKKGEHSHDSDGSNLSKDSQISDAKAANDDDKFRRAVSGFGDVEPRGNYLELAANGIYDKKYLIQLCYAFLRSNNREGMDVLKFRFVDLAASKAPKTIFDPDAFPKKSPEEMGMQKRVFSIRGPVRGKGSFGGIRMPFDSGTMENLKHGDAVSKAHDNPSWHRTSSDLTSEVNLLKNMRLRNFGNSHKHSPFLHGENTFESILQKHSVENLASSRPAQPLESPLDFGHHKPASWERRDPLKKDLVDPFARSSSIGAQQSSLGQQSYLERLFDKSFDIGNTATSRESDLTALKVGTSVRGYVELAWQYMDPHGRVHGPFDSKQMHKWYLKNFFPPNLALRCGPNEPWKSFKSYYPAGTLPFIDPPVGYSIGGQQQGSPAATNKGESLVEEVMAKGFLDLKKAKPEQTCKIGGSPSSVLESPASLQQVHPPVQLTPAQMQQKEAQQRLEHVWNKHNEVKVDSLLDIMETQKAQQTLSARTESTPPRSPAPQQPKSGWNIRHSNSQEQAISDDFPTLSTHAKPKRIPEKERGHAGAPSHGHAAPSNSPSLGKMPLKLFMEQVRTSSPRGQMTETFASKLMAGKGDQ
ncbi:bifunctional GYF domain/GYF-like domain superfamily [Babesia duncani]|uniref:Bifunctional GYF domain/GYF-like domain superfamily n=1 Tax=Babesia duncani TaxID=323732 RepID=A0AAD9UMT6_9APIC|nr:bifunctional GYF domain/GYF-like domain superfamily [Babesia duncani]